FAPGILPAFGLYLVRTSALVISAPLLGRGIGVSGYKVALIFFLSFLLFAVTGEPLAAETAPVQYAILVMREIMLGLFFSFLLQAAILAARVAGEIIGYEMGFNMSSVVDPVNGISTPLVAHIYEVFFFLSFLAIDGHHWLLRALGQSFERAPVGSVELSDNLLDVALAQFSQMFAAGLTFAAPVLTLLVLVSLLMGLLTRAVPQLNVLEFGFNLRIVVALVAMLLFAPLFQPAVDGICENLMNGLEAGLAGLDS
ncbi:MAG: flagellar biosynthetic protein FliR, partial [Planctomycetota bacterium]|nr:flagellar biosynthetic protein FliR [Planctomycetota bacterium]